MKKLIFKSTLASFLLVLLVGCKSQSYMATTDTSMTIYGYGLKGKVKTTTERHYWTNADADGKWYKGNVLEGGNNNHIREYFDRDGRYLQKDFLSYKGDVRAVYTVEWSADKKTVLYDEYTVNGKTIYKADYSYPRKNLQVSETLTSDGKQRMHFETELKKGLDVNCIYTLLDSDGEVSNTTEMKKVFDSKRRVVEFIYTEDRYDTGDYHFQYEFIEADKKGNWTKALKKDILEDRLILIEREIAYYE